VYKTRPTETVGLAAYRVMYENSTDGVLFATPTGDVHAANPAACALLRMTEDQIIATGCAGLADADDPRWHLGKAQQDREGQTRGLARVRRGDGTLCEFDVTSKVFHEVDGSPRSVMLLRDPAHRQAVQREVEDLRHRLRSLSLTDDLTGLANRRGLIATGSQLLELAERQRSDLQILFVEVDDVAGLNERRSHDGGDAALQAVARALAVAFRRNDLLARIGGTQFLAIAFGLTTTDRVGITARLHQHLADMETTAFVGEPVTVSLGWVTRRPGDPASLEQLVARSDWAMYEARETTRDAAGPPSDLD
jgi:diguanylate cyclase (GGDEF)-like protein/PAS domain S-box-containing protein